MNDVLRVLQEALNFCIKLTNHIYQSNRWQWHSLDHGRRQIMIRQKTDRRWVGPEIVGNQFIGFGA